MGRNVYACVGWCIVFSVFSGLVSIAPLNLAFADEWLTQRPYEDVIVELLVSPIEASEGELGALMSRIESARANEQTGVLGDVAESLALVELGQVQAAAERLEGVLRQRSAVLDLSSYELGLLVAGCGHAAAALPDADQGMSLKLEQHLVEILQDQAVAASKRVEALEVAYACGQWQVLRKLAGPTSEADVPYRLRELAARSWAETFWQMADGEWLSPQRAQSFREVAGECTRAFEFALAAAPDEFTKVRLAAHWWTQVEHSQFDADSKVMRKPLSTTRPRASAVDADALAGYVRSFRSTASRAVKAVGARHDWSDQRVNDTVDVFVGAFEWVLAFDPPEAVVREVIEDVPAFVDAAFGDFIPSHSPDGLRRTMRWYLWQAMVLEEPSPEVQRIINHQVRRFAVIIRQRLELITRQIDDERMAALYSDRYLKHYRTHRDNRFFPYFRHPKSPQLWEHMRDHDKRGTADIVGRFSDIPPTPGRPAEEQEAAAQRRAQHFCEALLSNLWFDFARDDRPWRLLQLPDAVIYSSGGFLYGTGQYVFDVGRTREPSGFRAEKGLTPAEYRRLESSTRPASQEE